MTAPTWPPVVAAVEHDPGPALQQVYPSWPEKEAAEQAENERLIRVTPPRCSALGVFGWRHGKPVYPEYRCDCTRDARIGAGIAAVRESDSRCNADLRPAVSSEEWWAQIAAKDAAAFAAFREATVRAKEEGI